MEKAMENYSDKALELIYHAPKGYQREGVFMCDLSAGIELRRAKDTEGRYICESALENLPTSKVYGYRVFFDDMFSGLTFAPLPSGYKSAQPK
jgi:predicted phage gp36 major capsid-like protein